MNTQAGAIGRQTIRPLSDLAAELGRLKRKAAKIQDDISGNDAADLMAKIHAVIMAEKIATLEWAMGIREFPVAIGAGKISKAAGGNSENQPKGDSNE